MVKQYWTRGVAGLAALGMAFGILASPVQADQIFIQQSGSTPAAGEPNVISDTSAFNVGVNGSATLQSPLLVIVGVYDGNGTPSISFSGCTTPAACPLATVGTYGLTSNTASFTSGDAFDALGLTQAGGSEGFGNWSTADQAAGFTTPTSFSLYAFAVDTSLTDTPISLDESGAANGSFIIAFSCKSGTGSNTTPSANGGCAKNGDVGQTVFTNTGFIDGTTTSVPEPGTLALFAGALLGLGLIARRRGARAS